MADDELRDFEWLDYLIFSALLGMSFIVGIVQRFTGNKQKSTTDYLLGNRQLSMIPTTVSMFMSYISAIVLLGNTAEMYQYGTQQWMSLLGTVGAYIVTSILYVPLTYKLQITSVYEYHEMRFKSKVVRLTNTVLSLLSAGLYMGLAMYAPATALEAVTGFPMWASILCTGGLATVYTTLGGIRAVVWTDFFQGFVMLGGLIIILVLGSNSVGGLSKVWEISKEGGRIEFFNMNPDPTIRMTFWTATLGGFFTSITTASMTQNHVQRYIALPTLRDAQISVIMQLPCMFTVYLLANLIGLTVYAYYAVEGCDPLRAGTIGNSNQLLPYFVIDVLDYPGLPGLFVAVLFSGALSSVSSSVSGMSAVTWKDFLEPYFKKTTEFRRTLVTKFLVFAYGMTGVGLAFLFKMMTGHVMVLTSSILGGIGGPMAGVMIVGSLLPWVEWKGSLAGLFAGLFMTTWINVGQQIYTPWVETLDTNIYNCTLLGNATIAPLPQNPAGVFGLYRISYYLIGLVGWTTTVIVSIIVSFSLGFAKPSEQDPRTILNLPDSGCCMCVPQTHRDKCYCGVNREQEEEQEEDIEKEPRPFTMERDGGGSPDTILPDKDTQKKPTSNTTKKDIQIESHWQLHPVNAHNLNGLSNVGFSGEDVTSFTQF